MNRRAIAVAGLVVSLALMSLLWTVFSQNRDRSVLSPIVTNTGAAINEAAVQSQALESPGNGVLRTARVVEPTASSSDTNQVQSLAALSICGSILDESDQTVAGMELIIHVSTAEPGVSLVSDSNGAFACDLMVPIAPKSVRLQIAGSSGFAQLLPYDQILLVSANTEIKLELRCTSRSIKVHGTLVDSSGSPIHNGIVVFNSQEKVVTDSFGEFACNVSLWAERIGVSYGQGSDTRVVSSHSTIIVSEAERDAGELSGLVLVLPTFDRTRTIRVTDTSGKPLVDASVSDSHGLIEMRTNQLGKASILMSSIDDKQVIVEKDGYARQLVLLAHSKTEVVTEVVLQKTKLVRGSVQTEDSVPVPGAVIDVYAGETIEVLAVRVYSDGNGNFSFVAAFDGTVYKIVAYAEGGARGQGFWFSGMPDPKIRMQPIQITRGIVVDSDGNPVEGCSLTAYCTDLMELGNPSDRSNADGTFSLTTIQGRRYRVSAVKRGFANIDVSVTAGEVTTIRLACAPSLKGVLTSGTPKPRLGLKIRLEEARDEEPLPLSVWIDVRGEGIFSVESPTLSDGAACTLVIRDGSRILARLPATVRCGGEGLVRFEIPE
jgi:Carboxypeptidase regulatory-like domain